jgi:hypothetical protein
LFRRVFKDVLSMGKDAAAAVSLALNCPNA